MEKGNMKALIFCSLLVQSVIGNAVVSVTHDTGTSYTCGLANTAITISCTITGLSKAVVWSKNGILQVTCSNLVDTCVHGPGYNESRYTFSSNVSQAKFDFHISAATFPTDEGIYACQHGGDNANFTIRVCSKCTVDPVMNAEVNPTGTVQEGEVVSVTCNQGYVINGNSLLTCQSDGKWDVSWPACKECCELVICYIGVITSVPFTIAVLGLYFFKRWVFVKIIHMDFILKVVLPSSCGIVVGIGLVVGLCIGLCSECPDRLAVGIGPGVPLVLCLNPCCSVGIILVHWKILKGHKVDRERKDGGAQYPLKKKPGDKTDSAGSEVHKGQDQSEKTNGKSDASKTAKL